MRKKLWLIVGGAVFLVVALLLIIPFFIDVDQYKPRIVKLASETAGRPVTISGDLSLKLLPTPRLAAEGVTIANAPGFASEPLLRIGTLDVTVALFPLFSGDLEVNSLVLREPTLLLQDRGDGEVNWELGGDVEDGASDGESVIVEDIRIVDGAVTYENLAQESRQEVRSLDAELSMRSRQGPFAFAAEFEYDGRPIRIEADVGRLGQDAPAAVEARAALGDGAARFTYSGEIREAAGDVHSRGAVALSARSAAKLAAALGAGADTSLPDLPLELEGTLVSNDQYVSLDDGRFQLGASRGVGSVMVPTAGDGPARLAAVFESLDLAPFIGGESEAPLVGPFALELPRDTTFTAEIRSAKVVGAPLEFGESIIRAELAGGAAELSMAARLAGGGRMEFAGTLRSTDGYAAFDGKVEADIKDLRAVLSQIEALPGNAPDTAFNRLRIESDVALRGETVQLNALDVLLDESQMTGQLSYALRARPFYRARLEVDQVDLDRYQSAEAAARSAETDEAGGPSLADFDADIDVAIGRLERGGQSFGDVRADLRLLQGVLNIDQLSVGRAADVLLAVRGTARNLAKTPKLDLRLEGQGQGLDRLLTLIGEPVPENFAATGPFRLGGTAAGTTEALALDLSASVGALRLTAKGKVEELGSESPALDMTIDGRHDSFAALLAQFGVLEGPGEGEPAPLSISAKLKGHADDLSAAGQFSTESGRIALTFDRQGSNSQTGRLTAKADSMKRFLRDLGFDYRPAAETLGALDVALGFKSDGGDKTRLAPINAKLGPVALTGEGTLDLRAEVPRVEVALRAPSLPVDDLLPPPETGAEQAAEEGQRWSEEPFDLEFLKSVDGRFELAADEGAYLGYAFDELRVIATSDGPTLNFEDVSGRLFGGTTAMTLALDARTVPALRFTIEMEGVPVEQALMASAAIEPATGTMRLAGEFAGGGASEKAIMASLKGSSSFAAEKGVIRGLDLVALNERFGALATINDFVRLTGTALGGGETPYQIIAFDTVVENGMLVSRNERAEITGAAADFSGRVNLPAWTIDGAAAIKLADHPDAPALGAKVVGPVDSPTITYQTDAMRQWLGTRLGAAVLKGVVRGEGVGLKDLLGGGREQPAEAPAPQETPATAEPDSSGWTEPQPAAPGDAAPAQTTSEAEAPKKPEDEIKDLIIEGLFGRKKKT